MVWILRAALLAGWIAMLIMSVRAITGLGADTAGDVFFADLAHPWRGQFNFDLILHLVLMAGWISWREKRFLTGAPFAALSVLTGGVFTFGYMLIATFTARDAASFLLGKRRTQSSIPMTQPVI
ncbi:hypothetical protein BBF93_04970 [Hyphomonas sp. CACIAM 19H1]|uniref:hypothetical protein n=1 Tax=Hyphomonas sp. CACIAM 19H1 TaxID=1873716 RepID=UPI000DED808D|nr:hypothetical protein [Hyphomonas sp. CACIAM 19H1]AXE63645.1 hypothetical protein BBF93_04970 [Hyphomonas sp. CACIAM 19H1]